MARSTFPSQNVKSTACSDHFLKVQMWFCVAGARDSAPKVSKAWGFCSISKNNGRRGTLDEDLERCISRGGRSTGDMFIRDVRRSGRWFSERGCILEHQTFSFGKMILCDRCRTSYDLASLFRGRRNTLDTWTGNIAKRIGTRPSALHLTFHYWRKSRRIASFLMLPTSKIEEVSQTCFVLTLWSSIVGSLAELPRLMLSSSKIDEVSQNSFVFKLADRQIDRQLRLQLQLQVPHTTLHNVLQLQIYQATLHYTTLIASN